MPAKRLLVAFVIVAGLLPAAPLSAQSANLLTNPDFEAPGYVVGCCSSISEGWTPFWRIREPGMPEFRFHEPQFGNNYRDRRRNGDKSQTWGKDYATHDGGVWQRVRLPAANGKLILTAWMAGWSGNGNNWGDSPQSKLEKLIGIDPTGATDVWAGTVMWSPIYSGTVDWQELRLETEARGEWATVYLRARNELPMQRNAAFTDEIALRLEPPQAPAPTPRPTEAVPGTRPPAPAPAGPSPVAGSRRFAETGYAIADDAFWDYFNRRGGLRTFGYPVSRKFRLLGSEVQIFQRRIMQKQPNGSVGLLNVLDQEYMPYSSFNNATVPPFDAALVGTAPAPGSSSYGAAILDYVRRVAPDRWMGYPTNFQRSFTTSVTAAEVFAGRPGDPGLLPGFQLELWGVPTSAPQVDPNNANFVFQRWQRGVMHHDRTTGLTQGLLLADYFKAIVTGQNLPADVANAARGGRFFQQYAPGRPGAVARPGDLPNTDMTDAFVQEQP
ncbi:MAG TPA: hypothetical protein VG370_03075 [Chloroflexota bacterium]|jgi:hypothetical protein|nr:hypothetical protein [Chloroflexota bacterium]